MQQWPGLSVVVSCRSGSKLVAMQEGDQVEEAAAEADQMFH